MPIVSVPMSETHLWKAVLCEHVKQSRLATLAVAYDHYLAFHTLSAIHPGFQ